MTATDVLEDGFGRVAEEVGRVLDGLGPDDLLWRPAPGANSIAWLLWHLTRVQDHYVAELGGAGQVWTAGGWSDRFGLDLDPADTGYGHDAAQAARVRADATRLAGYHEAVRAVMAAYLGGLAEAELDRVVDRSWDPPVTLGVRLVSILADDLQHVGQAAYVRGLLLAG